MQGSSSHLYHMVNPSPWPFLVSMSLFNVLAGFLLWVNKYVMGGNIVLMSFVMLVFFVQFWFADMVSEGSYEGKHTTFVQKGLKLGMILFIVSEMMFFFGFFWGYFHFSLSPAVEMGCLWPPYGIQIFDYLHMPLYNTFMLLVSGVCVTWCHHNMISGKQTDEHMMEESVMALMMTMLLAMLFTFYQALEYTEASFNMSDSVYGTIFFVATGFHGFHVMMGTCFLTYCLFSLWKGHFGMKHHLGLEFAMWYWHFVDVVWLFLYVCVYWWASTSLV